MSDDGFLEGPSDTIILLVDFRGDVQGVGFRDFVRREADRRKLEGWVRNRTDGSVEAVFRGEKRLIEDMLAVCREGPPAARVESIRGYGTDPEVFELRPAGVRFAVLPTA